VAQGRRGVREQVLHTLLAEATAPEQRFLVALLAGELRQGALGGVMTEGIATAAGVPGDVVRRAAMLSGELPAVALAAFDGGEAALRPGRAWCRPRPPPLPPGEGWGEGRAANRVPSPWNGTGTSATGC